MQKTNPVGLHKQLPDFLLVRHFAAFSSQRFCYGFAMGNSFFKILPALFAALLAVTVVQAQQDAHGITVKVCVAVLCAVLCAVLQ